MRTTIPAIALLAALQSVSTIAVAASPPCADQAPGGAGSVTGVVAKGGSYATALTLGGKSAKAARIVVQPGKDTIDLVLASTGEPILWSIEGAVERVGRVSVPEGTNGPSGAVVGIPKERVGFLSGQACLAAIKSALGPDGRIELDAVPLTGSTGKLHVRHGVSDVLLPSGDQTHQAGPDRLSRPSMPATLAAESVRLGASNPAATAILTIDQAKVVAKTSVTAGEGGGYFGIQQLVDRGDAKVEPVPGNSWFDLIPTKAIRIPPGIGSGLRPGQGVSIRAIVLNDGIPRPEGSEGICFLDGKTGFPLDKGKGSSCSMLTVEKGLDTDGAIDCRAKPSPEGSELILALAGSSEMGSDVSIAKDRKQPAGVTRISVEPGDRPLHLAVSVPQNNIILLDGSVERIARLTAMHTSYGRGYGPMVPNAGVIGLAPERFEVISGSACPSDLPREVTAEKLRIGGSMQAAFGKSPDRVLGKTGRYAGGDSYTDRMSSFQVPSGKPVGKEGLPPSFQADPSKTRTLPVSMRQTTILKLDPNTIKGAENVVQLDR